MVSIENILSNLSYNIFNQSEIETLESKIITKAEEDRFRYYIYCLVRNRLIQLTPEEVIRQLYLHKLTYTYKYPKELLRVEYPIQFGSDNTKRADIVILNKEHPDSIDIIIEVKNPEIQYGKEQLKSYCNATGSPIGIWVNGNEIRFFKRNEPNYFLEIDNIPIYENSLNSFDKPRFEHIPKSDGIEYKMLLKDVEIDFDYWNNFMDDENNGIFILISEMLDNGQVEKKEKSILIPYEEISNLNSIEQKILGLPTKYPYKIRIQANGAIHENNFTYK